MDIYLDKLEIHGFKSFPDKTVIKFHKGITVVVGPNGCGKSNIVDAILWVLGEQRIKNLRGENNEDLIFNGNPSKKPLGMTEVGAHFIKNSEPVYIARKFFRTGDSKYILNEKYCRHKDIRDALFDMQLGDRNYFIFEQGSIDKLISLKPTEKRLLIEEAAGISQYLERKKETTNKLIIAEQNLENIEILAADKESRLKDLKNQVNYVRRYRELKKRRNDCLQSLIKLKAETFQSGFRDHKKQIEGLINQESMLAGEIRSLEKELLQQEEQRWQLDKQLKQGQQDIYQAEQKTMAGENEIEKIKQRQVFVRQRIKEIETSCQVLEEEVLQAETVLQEEKEVLEDLQAQLQKGRSRHEAKTSDLGALQKKLEELTASRDNLHKRIFQAESQAAAFNNDIQDLSKQITRSENEMISQKRFIEELTSQISQKEIEAGEKALEKSKKELKETESKYDDNLAMEASRQSDISNMRRELDVTRSEITSLENQKRKFLEIKEKITPPGSTSGDMRESPRIQELLKTKKEHHTVLENFYFDELDARTDIPLSEASRSRANKILLQCHQAKQLNEEIARFPGFIGFIKDLFTLSASQKAKSFLKNGALVDTVENGIAMFSKYGIEVVTLDGAAINRDGLLSRNRERGILSLLEDIRSIETRLTEQREQEKARTARLQEAEQKLADIQRQGQILNKEKAAKQEQQITLQSQLDTLQKAASTNQQRIDRSQSEIDRIAAEKQKLESELKTLQQKQAEIEKTRDDLRKEQQSLQDKISELGEKIGQEEKSFLNSEHAVNLLKEKQAVSRQKINDTEKRCDSIRREIAANRANIETFTEELEQSSRQQKEIRNQVKDSTRRGDDLKTGIKTMETEFESSNKKIKEINAALGQAREKLASVKEQRNELEIEFSSLKKDVSQLEITAQNELNQDLESLQISEEFSDRGIPDITEEYEQLNERWQKMRDSDRLNFSAESEQEILSQETEFLLTQKEDVVKSILDMQKAIQQIDEESHTNFLTAFKQIRANFIKNFQILFNGGEAELTLTDPENLSESGLEIQAQPHGKKLQNLRLLSGGEKALTSLAFLFSLFEYKPSPFCVFDEVDAALDESNIRRFLTFVHNLKSQTQFLLITHNFKTMEEADYIYGISMNEPGISTIYSLEMDEKTGLPVTENGDAKPQ